MTKTHVAVMGWIEVEVGILGLGCILARFWVTDCSYDKCIPVVLGSHQIKKVYAKARVENIKYWPAPWKDLYEWNAVNKWHGYGCSCHGAMIMKGLVLYSRRGLLAYVYNGVSLSTDVLHALVAGNGS